MTSKNKNKSREFPFFCKELKLLTEQSLMFYHSLIKILKTFICTTFCFKRITFRIKTDYNNYTDQIIKTDILKILIPEKNDFCAIILNCQQFQEAHHTEKYTTKTKKNPQRKYKKKTPCPSNWDDRKSTPVGHRTFKDTATIQIFILWNIHDVLTKAKCVFYFIKGVILTCEDRDTSTEIFERLCNTKNWKTFSARKRQLEQTWNFYNWQNNFIASTNKNE